MNNFGLSDAEIAKTLDLIKSAQAEAASDALAKATTSGLTTTTAIQGYDLEAPAKNLYPVLAPLRKRIKRSPAVKGSNAINWKAITGIAQGGSSVFVAEGARNSNIQYTEADKIASYKTWGLDDKVTWEAELQARGFEDLRARSSMSLMQLVMLLEEDVLIGANTSQGLGNFTGNTVAPTLAASGSGNTLPTATYSVRVVALPFLGYRGSSAPNTLSAYHSGYSGETSQAITLGQALTATIPPVAGAVAYAWFVGTATGAANEKLEKITTINSVTFTAPLAGTGPTAATSGTADASTDTLAFDGIIPQLIAGGGYNTSLATGTAGTGTGLTYDNAGGIVEIDAMLKSLWDNSRISPEVILFNSQEALNFDKKIMTAGGQPIFQLMAPVGSDAQQGLMGGIKVVRYINKFTAGTIELIVHPTMTPGSLLALTFQLPEWYINPNIESIWDLHMLADYTELVYAMTLRQYEHGVYCRGVLRGFLPAANGLITNIGNL